MLPDAICIGRMPCVQSAIAQDQSGNDHAAPYAAMRSRRPKDDKALGSV